MNVLIFDFSDYRAYLKGLLKSYPKKGHGVRSVWAQALNCQVAFVSHVLNGLYDFSIEQGEALTRYLAFSKDETEYFLLLLQKERAGTHELKKFYTQLIQEKISEREDIRKRMKIKENLSVEDQAIYYSKWLYSATHILLTIPEFQTSPEKIAQYFNTPLVTIREILEFLETRKLIVLKNGRYLVQDSYIFINKDSPLFSHQQSFWRQKAIEAIYQNNREDIHFASIFTISESDLKKVKEILLKSIEETTEIIKPSKEEKLYSICMDLFEVK
ncbi:TIGR02147 family protein [Bdellovibrio sp. HCB337]|uniref:TIGR02147 family protein n=1 Tax=Bdellovibrio sp. HCB337 TaxID=3394358 RepID=UPI0039A4B5B9